MDAYRSQDTVIYRPEGMEGVVLCREGEVMVSLVDVVPSVQVQREAVIGSRWQWQAARGNAVLQMSLAVARVFGTVAAARAWGLDLQELLAMNPEGTVLWETAFYDGVAQRERVYRATVDSVHARALTSDSWYGGDGAWCVVEMQFTLTGEID